MPAVVRKLKRAVLARPGLRGAAETAVVARSVAVIVRSGMFDRAWYEAQTGDRHASDLAAVRDYVTRGRRAGLSPHPLFEPAWAEPKTWHSRTLDPFAHHLVSFGRRTKVDPHPLFSTPTWIAAHPEARRHPGGALGHFLATSGPDTPLPLTPGDEEAAAVVRGAAADGSRVAGSTPGDQTGVEQPGAAGPGDADGDGDGDDDAGDGDDAGAADGHLARPPVTASVGHPIVTRGSAVAALTTAVTAAAARRQLSGPRQTPRLDGEAQRAFRASVEGIGPSSDPTARAAADPGSGHTARPAPVVSVVMPAWNRGGVLRRAVASVQAQTLPDWELLVVDDGSVDDTLAVLAGLTAFDDRVRVLTVPHGGVSRARNAGISAARAPWLAFLDTDNTWEPDFLATMVAGLTVRGLAAGYAAMRLEHGSRVTYRGYDGGLDALRVGNHVDLNVLVADTRLVREVGGFAEDLRRTVDYDLVLSLAERTTVGHLAFVGAVYSAGEQDTGRISVDQPLSWDAVVRLRHLRRAPGVPGPALVRGRTSVVLPVLSADGRPDAVGAVCRRVWSLLRASVPVETAGADVEVVVTDGSGSRAVAALLASAVLVDPRVRVEAALGSVGTAMAVDLALDRVTGATTVVLDVHVAPERGWLAPLTAPLADASVVAAGALALGVDGLLTSAGAVFPVGIDLPVQLLAGQPAGDATGGMTDAPDAALLDVGSLRTPVWAARTADLLAVGGLDALFGAVHGDVDLGLRLVAHRGGGRVVTVPAARAVGSPTGPDPVQARFDERTFRDRWAGRLPDGAQRAWRVSGTELAHVAGHVTRAGVRALRPVVVRPARRVPDGPAAGLPSLRWVLQTAAPAGSRRRLWGDWHFAGSLAGALRRLGQDAVLLPRDLATRPAAAVDDVVLTIRGLTAREPDPATSDLLWVISHPDGVDTAELARHGHVFAASLSWAERMTALSGRTVEPLLQCTDPAVFAPPAWLRAPDGSPVPRERRSVSREAVLFVGNSRGVARPVVEQTLQVRPDLAVWGGGWAGTLPPGVLRGGYVPNSQLAGHYAGAGIVLNDHWDDMRLNGFLSNRLFDAVASGARVVSDRVAGATEVFGGSVAVFDTAEQLHDLVTADVEEVFPPLAERLDTAARIAAEHSFDARARRLLQVALADRGVVADLAG